MAASKQGVLTRSLASKSVVEKVVDEITSAIIAGRLAPGDKIPTEEELCESLGVGRNSIREAIKILISYGVLQIKRPEGTFVCEKFNHNMLDPMIYGLILQKDSASGILELRQVFDIGIIQTAIEKAKPEDVRRLKDNLERLKQEILDPNTTPERSLDADIIFHQAISNCINNSLLYYIANYIDRITIPSRIRTMRGILENGKQQSFIELHERLVELVEKKKLDEIAPTVKDHYQYWEKELESFSEKRPM